MNWSARSRSLSTWLSSLVAANAVPTARVTLVVDLGGGTWLTLPAMNSPSATIGKEDLLEVADALQIATPDLSWMGR